MSESSKPKKNVKFLNLRFLRISLKYRPEILKLIMKMRKKIKIKTVLVKELTLKLKKMQKQIAMEDLSTQTDDMSEPKLNKPDTVLATTIATSLHHDGNTKPNNLELCNISTSSSSIRKLPIETDNIQDNDVQKTDAGWKTEENKGEKSIAEQVKEAAQSAMQQSGMVYVDSIGMYYDYKTGYYYNSELGLYYHTDTDCYYYYSEEKQSFVFHSYPDRTVVNTAFVAHQKKKARKHKMEKKKAEDIDNLTKSLSQGKEDLEVMKPKRKKVLPKKTETVEEDTKEDHEDSKLDGPKDNSCQKNAEDTINRDVDSNDVSENIRNDEDMEDGECSDTSSEAGSENGDTNDSASTVSDDDAIAKLHPPCMRVIVRETNLPKLKVGSLFMVTKDGGTIGREGDHHTIILKDNNVSRNHLDLKYDSIRKVYTAKDLGSKNGTILNGIRMSESQIVSSPIEIMHGSTLQLGETKLLCHIHSGNDTCGHCEPGLLMELEDKDKKVAYTRTCSVQKQHQLELARLKNKYAPKPLSIEATAYNDRAQVRRDTVGSSHNAEKTQSSDLNTFIEPENKGFKLLEKMGWSKGEGLGKDSQGDIEPVPLICNEGKSGLGCVGAVGTASSAPNKVQINSLGKATMRLANRTKMLNPPAKAFQEPIDDELSE